MVKGVGPATKAGKSTPLITDRELVRAQTLGTRFYSTLAGDRAARQAARESSQSPSAGMDSVDKLSEEMVGSSTTTSSSGPSSSSKPSSDSTPTHIDENYVPVQEKSYSVDDGVREHLQDEENSSKQQDMHVIAEAEQSSPGKLIAAASINKDLYCTICNAVFAEARFLARHKKTVKHLKKENPDYVAPERLPRPAPPPVEPVIPMPECTSMMGPNFLPPAQPPVNELRTDTGAGEATGADGVVTGMAPKTNTVVDADHDGSNALPHSASTVDRSSTSVRTAPASTAPEPTELPALSPLTDPATIGFQINPDGIRSITNNLSRIGLSNVRMATSMRYIGPPARIPKFIYIDTPIVGWTKIVSLQNSTSNNAKAGSTSVSYQSPDECHLKSSSELAQYCIDRDIPDANTFACAFQWGKPICVCHDTSHENSRGGNSHSRDRSHAFRDAKLVKCVLGLGGCNGLVHMSCVLSSKEVEARGRVRYLDDCNKYFFHDRGHQFKYKFYNIIETLEDIVCPLCTT